MFLGFACPEHPHPTSAWAGLLRCLFFSKILLMEGGPPTPRVLSDCVNRKVASKLSFLVASKRSMFASPSNLNLSGHFPSSFWIGSRRLVFETYAWAVFVAHASGHSGGNVWNPFLPGNCIAWLWIIFLGIPSHHICHGVANENQTSHCEGQTRWAMGRWWLAAVPWLRRS